MLVDLPRRPEDSGLPLINQMTICKSQRHFVSAAAAILKEVLLGSNLIQSGCCCTVVCQSFGRTAKFCKSWGIVDSLSCDAWLSLSIAMVWTKLKKGVLCTANKKGGRKRAVSPQCEVRLKMATAEPAWGRPNHRKSYAMLCGWATWGRFLCFLRGSGRFGSTVTNISGSTGYLTSKTN